MRKITLFMAIALITASLTVGCAKDDAADRNVLSILDVYADPYAFTGDITLTGIAGNFLEQDPVVFDLYYTETLLAKDSCCLISFPTKFPDNLPRPKLGDEINVTGRFIRYDVDMGYGWVHDIVFEVEEIEVIRNIMHLFS
jgi:hypothetical protein